MADVDDALAAVHGGWAGSMEADVLASEVKDLRGRVVGRYPSTALFRREFRTIRGPWVVAS